MIAHALLLAGRLLGGACIVVAALAFAHIAFTVAGGLAEMREIARRRLEGND